MRLLAIPAAVLGLAAGMLAAEPSVFSYPLTPASRPALASICGRIAEQAVVKGTFTQVKHMTRLSKDFVSRGRFVVAAEWGILWEVLTPVASTTVMTRSRMVQRTPDGRSIVLSAGANPAFGRFADTLQAVFTGDLKAMEETFNVFFAGPEGALWRLGLVPKDRTMRAVIASMEIVGDDFVRDVLLTESSRDTVRYSFIDLRSAAALTADEEALFR